MNDENLKPDRKTLYYKCIFTFLDHQNLKVNSKLFKGRGGHCVVCTVPTVQMFCPNSTGVLSPELSPPFQRLKISIFTFLGSKKWKIFIIVFLNQKIKKSKLFKERKGGDYQNVLNIQDKSNSVCVIITKVHSVQPKNKITQCVLSLLKWTQFRQRYGITHLYFVIFRPKIINHK